MGRIGGWFCNSRKVGQWGPPVWQWHLIGEWGGPIGQRGNWWTERNSPSSSIGRVALGGLHGCAGVRCPWMCNLYVNRQVRKNTIMSIRYRASKAFCSSSFQLLYFGRSDISAFDRSDKLNTYSRNQHLNIYSTSLLSKAFNSLYQHLLSSLVEGASTQSHIIEISSS
jgi:hypothetical protein